MADPTPPGADRSLLLGVLALQLDFVGTTDLRNALQDWAADRSRPLAQVLVERGALAPRRRGLLESLVEEYLAQYDMDPAAGLSAARIARAFPFDLDTIPGLCDGSVSPPTLAASPGTLLGSSAKDLCPAAVGLSTSSGLRFRILRPHARGALGVVYLALDEELHREVALKEIQGPYHRSADSRARFLQEAEITGSLEHPGVVPVYGLGCHPDGRPFYAMRFIKGQSLQEAITRFHAGDNAGRDPSERSLALRELLVRFVAVCNAVAYAHSRGVIHRDLKPGNVMLGPFGETLVGDWGLAKVIDRPERPASGEAPVQLVTAGAEATLLGQAVGTPAFMSPEQAAGRLGDVGPASDVYSLGATLYALLAGVPPFPGYDVTEVLEQVVARQFPPPRQVKRAVPAALEAVVLRAMAGEPQDRYASADALAREVERWLADEPVAAYRERAWQRAQRWAKRHRTAVTAAVALLLTATVALGAGLYFVGRARDQARHNLAVAEKNLRTAKTAVDQCFLVATEDPLLQKDSMQGVRRLLLREALPFYEGFLDQRPDDLGIQEELARTHFRVGVITEDIGRKDDAARSYEQARRLFLELAQEYPDVEKYRVDLARARNNLGNLRSEAGQSEQAAALHEQARQLRENLDAGDDRPELRADLALTLTNLGALRAREGKAAEARELFGRAAGIQRGLMALYPNAPRHQAELAAALNHLGVTLTRLKDNDAADRAFGEARELREKLVKADAGSALYRAALADTLLNQGVLLSETGKPAEARDACEQARKLFAELAGEHREVAEFRSGLANALTNLGEVLAVAGERKEALAAYREAERLQTQLAKDHPAVVRYAVDQAGTALGLAEALREDGQFAEAVTQHGRAIDLAGRLASREANLPGLRTLARKAHAGRARALDRLKRHRDAAADWSAALEQADGDEQADLRAGRAASLALAGDYLAAMKEVYQLERQARSGERLYSLACAAALASAAARRDGRSAEVGRSAATAISLLERAREAGLFQDAEMAAHLKKDTDLDALRSRPDFRALLRRVEKRPGE